MKLLERFKFAQTAFSLSKKADQNPIIMTNDGIFQYKPFGTIQSLPPELNFSEFFKGWAACCTNKRSDAIAMKVNYGVIENSTDSDKPLQNDHWLTQLLIRPNVHLGLNLFQIKKLTCQWLDYFGNAYIHLPLNGGLFPTQMWVLESNRVWINTGSDKLIESYSYSNWSGTHIIPANEICHIKTLAPSNRIYENFYIGQPSLLNAAISAIQADEEQKIFLKNFYQRDGLQSLTLNAPAGNQFNSIEEIQQLKREITNKTLNRSIVAALPGGYELRQVPTAALGAQAVSQDLAKEQNAMLICGIFGVPIGLINSSFDNYATAQILKSEFQEMTIEPLMQQIESTLTMYFKQFDSNIKVTHKPFIYNDIDMEIKKKSFLLDYGILNRNDIRSEEGIDPIVDGDKYFVKSNLVPIDNLLNADVVSTSPIIETLPKELQVTNESKSLKNNINKYATLTEPERKRQWKSIDSISNIYLKKLKSILKDSFEDLKQEIISNVNKHSFKSISKGKEKTGIADNMYLFDLNKWKKIIEKKTDSVTANHIISIIKQTMKQSDAGNFIDTEWADVIAQSTKLSSSKITEPLQTIKLEIQSLIDNTIKNNILPVDLLKEQLKTDITSKFDNVYKQSRINNIAQTTSTFATGNAQHKTCNELDLKYVWMSERDGSVRATHIAMDGKEPDENKLFHPGGDSMEHPAAGMIASENCQCRCVLYAQK